MPDIAILGANGVYARHLMPRLTEDGIRVRAIVRRPEAAGAARAAGAEIAEADIFDHESLVRALDGCSTCINLATSLPGPSGRGDFAANDRLRRDGVPVLISACQDAGVARLVQQSIAMVCNGGDRVMRGNESPEPQGNPLATEALRAALEMETAVRSAPLDHMILRGGLFYGPGTGFDEAWVAQAVAGKLRLPAEPDNWVTLVHISDMAEATVSALRHWQARETIAVTDDQPTTWRRLFTHVCTQVGAEAPEPGDRPGFGSFRVSNERARNLLNWAPRYSSYASGLAR
ncbi:hypothetical protein ATO6_01780 [Oceanicola sp. 22II-s10i]|uniref:NAD-dependent epimerase/dehydratase family protein n=1 Tax=Oceanicola sp. 22II-s10i TaxID=1317116 RepID=UPI000B52891C|nr:NAD(P)-dependent oxidoreductase [Oceanicola sp. 22II-s10i]OWU85683.1 hypothetical protein ATO6_01780 [Oceanicola sp. 22II-s10i]